MMSRAMLIALASMAAAYGGCATPVATYESGPTSGVSASPAGNGAAPLPGNVFGPSTPHYFGTGGP